MTKPHFALIALLAFVLAESSALGQQRKMLPLPASINEHLDLVYAKQGDKRDREMHLDLYLPKSAGPHPVLMTVHGGGWLGGSKKYFRDIAVMLAARGYAVANVEYRLAEEAKFPGAVQDVAAAVRWLRGNATKYAIDPDRIGAVGGSAGGHLVGMVATTAQSKQYHDHNSPEQSSELQAAVLMGSGVDQVARVKETKGGSIGNCVIFFGAEYHDNPAIYVEASPITHVSKDTPSLLFLDGGLDKPGERYIGMRKRLDALDVTNELVVIDGAKHGHWGSEPYRSQFVKAMDAFFRKMLIEKPKH